MKRKGLEGKKKIAQGETQRAQKQTKIRHFTKFLEGFGACLSWRFCKRSFLPGLRECFPCKIQIYVWPVCPWRYSLPCLWDKGKKIGTFQALLTKKEILGNWFIVTGIEASYPLSPDCYFMATVWIAISSSRKTWSLLIGLKKKKDGAFPKYVCSYHKTREELLSVPPSRDMQHL